MGEAGSLIHELTVDVHNGNISIFCDATQRDYPSSWRMMSLHMESMLSNPRCLSSEPHELRFCLVGHTFGLHKTNPFFPASLLIVARQALSKTSPALTPSSWQSLHSRSSSMIGTSQAATEDSRFCSAISIGKRLVITKTDGQASFFRTSRWRRRCRLRTSNRPIIKLRAADLV